MCARGGGTTLRHNVVWNTVYDEAVEGGCRPEHEKMGLLPAAEDNEAGTVACEGNKRRPADVWLPGGPSGRQEALGFAVTSGGQASELRNAFAAPELLFERHDRRKREYKNTAAQCAAGGLCFTPMVF